MIVINNLAIPVEADTSIVPDLNDCVKFYISNVFKYPEELGNSLELFLSKCYEELKKGEDSEFQDMTFNQAMKKLEEYNFMGLEYHG